MATCPCGSGVPDGACCGPLLGGVPAPTALALMRSRYTAYVRGAVDYLIETDDATTRGAMDRAEPRRYSAALPVGAPGNAWAQRKRPR